MAAVLWARSLATGTRRSHAVRAVDSCRRRTDALSGYRPVSSIWVNSSFTSASVSMFSSVSASLKSAFSSEASVLPLRTGVVHFRASADEGEVGSAEDAAGLTRAELERRCVFVVGLLSVCHARHPCRPGNCAVCGADERAADVLTCDRFASGFRNSRYAVVSARERILCNCECQSIAMSWKRTAEVRKMAHLQKKPAALDVDCIRFPQLGACDGGWDRWK